MRYSIIALCLLVVGCGESEPDHAWEYELANRAYARGYSDCIVVWQSTLAQEWGFVYDTAQAEAISKRYTILRTAIQEGGVIDTGIMFSR